MIEERVAVLEEQARQVENDITALFKALRDHMEKEDKDRARILSEVHSINESLSNQKSFWSGMLFAFTGIGTLIGTAIAYIKP